MLLAGRLAASAAFAESLRFAVLVLCITLVGHRCVTVAPAESTWVASTQWAVFLFMVNSVNTFWSCLNAQVMSTSLPASVASQGLPGTSQGPEEKWELVNRSELPVWWLSNDGLFEMWEVDLTHVKDRLHDCNDLCALFQPVLGIKSLQSCYVCAFLKCLCPTRWLWHLTPQ